MKKINNYILEKLKINKDIKLSNLPNKDDFVLSIKHNMNYHKKGEISLSLYIVISCDENELKCRQDGGVMIRKFKLNKDNKIKDDIFAYSERENSTSDFEYIINNYEKILDFLYKVHKNDENVEINNHTYKNVIYYDSFQYTSIELIKIFEEI